MSDPWQAALLHHERFLLRLAARLAGPESEPEDLVQDAFVRALERPPRARAAVAEASEAAAEDGSLRAWLATVLRRRAGRAARGARRRSDRERRAAIPEAREERADVDARLDAHAELLALLRDLPDGERQALFLRYAEDLAPPAIAARLGVPLETVRTRLRRGRERLRAQLDARHGGRAAWAALLLPAAHPLRPTPPAAPTGAASTTAAAAAANLGAGALVGATTKILAGAGATAVASAALFLALDPRGAHAPRASAPTVEPAGERAALASAPGIELTELHGAPDAKAERAAVSASSIAAPAGAVLPQTAPEPTRASWPLIVRAIGAPGSSAAGAPASIAAGAAVRVAAQLDAFGRYEATPLEGVLDAGGELRLDLGAHLADLVAHADGARPVELLVAVDHPDLVPVEASLLLPDPLDPARPPAEPLVALVPVDLGSIVVGRIVDEAREPLDGETCVQAHALRDGRPESSASGADEPALDGAFRLRVDGAGPFAVLAVGEHLRPGTALPVLARGSVVDVGDVVLSRGMPIDGRAVDLAGVPRKGATVFAKLVDAGARVGLDRFSFTLPDSLAWCDGAFELLAAEARTDADGAFRIGGLGARLYRLDMLAPLVDAPFELAETLAVVAPATVEVRPQAAELRVAVRFPGGPPRDGIAVWTRAEQEKRVGMPAWSYLRTEEGFAAAAITGFEEITGDPSFASEQTDDGATHPAPASTAPGRPYVRRFALPPNERMTFALLVDGCAPAELVLDVPDAGGLIERELVLAPNPAPARLVLALRGVPVPDGTPFVALVRSETGERDPTLRAHAGELVLDDLNAGPLRIVLSAGEDRFAPQDHLRDVRLDLVLAPGEERRVDVVLERGGTLILEALNPDGERIAASCILIDSAGRPVEVVFVARIPDGRAAGHGNLFPGGPSRAVPELAPGPYRAEISAGGHEPIVLDLVIEAGATTERSVTLRPSR